MSMGYFPFLVDVENLHGVIIGGGHVALEKVERLLSFNGKLTLIATTICDEIKEYSDRIELIEKEYQSGDLQDAEYVIAATNDPVINKMIYDDAKEQRLLVNAVDQPEICDFIFPSVIQRGRLVIGVSTSGAGPRVAIRLRKNIEKIIPDNIEEILDKLAEERIRAKEEIKDPAKRREYLIELANKLLDDEN